MKFSINGVEHEAYEIHRDDGTMDVIVYIGNEIRIAKDVRDLKTEIKQTEGQYITISGDSDCSWSTGR